MANRALPLGSILQYVVLGLLGYVLAGAPLLSIILGGSGGEKKKSRVGYTPPEIHPEKLSTLVIPEANLSCAVHTYKGVHVLSREPLVLYIEGFLEAEEVRHVVEISEPHFTPSTVWTSGQERLDPHVRLSHKAPVPRSDTVRCIEDRARAFQGWRPYVFIEKLWAQRYGPGGHYSYHYDWGNAVRGAGRISSFMVWLGDECEGGGTRFPRLERPVGQLWCKFIECGEEKRVGGEEGDDIDEEGESKGVTFKPIKGNAVYWENMKPDGTGYEESWHAGLPVVSGTKIGLNIWSWLQQGYDPHTTQNAVE
ncbi:hypothetical protein N0V90_003081 [Kalmusia sp. IMI 367209]|nr:hypothetical protein N0V90_003081 [Kalmusia sp. IMI 367209]